MPANAPVDVIGATHEAGHAVLAMLADKAIAEVVLHARPRPNGVGGHCRLHDVIGEIDADLVGFLIYCFGGAAAEKRQTGRTSARDADDRAYAVKVAATALDVEPTSPKVLALVQTAEQLAHARMLNPMVGEWVDNVAKALTRRGRLTSRDIQELRPEATR